MVPIREKTMYLLTGSDQSAPRQYIFKHANSHLTQIAFIKRNLTHALCARLFQISWVLNAIYRSMFIWQLLSLTTGLKYIKSTYSLTVYSFIMQTYYDFDSSSSSRSSCALIECVALPSGDIFSSGCELELIGSSLQSIRQAAALWHSGRELIKSDLHCSTIKPIDSNELCISGTIPFLIGRLGRLATDTNDTISQFSGRSRIFRFPI